MAAFYKESLKIHDSPSFSSCRIFACPQLPFILASPDRMMKCKCCGDRCIEIKCPFSLRETPFELGWKSLGYMECEDDKITLKKTHPYYLQVQGQMGCTGCQSSFFVVWDPVSASPHIEEIKFDPNFWEDMKRSLTIFFKQYVGKCLLKVRLINYCSLCGSHCLEENEALKDVDRSFKCTLCNIIFHSRCSKDVDGVCEGCLCNALEENFDE